MPAISKPKSVISACTMDCPDACSLKIRRTSSGELKIGGNPDHPFTQGFCCRKIKAHTHRLRSPHRILTPMRRRGETWEELDWENALDLCTAKIQDCRAEPASVLHLPGSGAKGVLKAATEMLFMHLGTSRDRGSLCDGAGFMAYIRDFGSRSNHPIHDLLNAGAIVNWGRDFSRSSVHMAALIRRARRKGIPVLTISPGGDGNDGFSDERITITPGTDRFLAAAVIQYLRQQNRIAPQISLRCKHWERFNDLIRTQSTLQLVQNCGVTPTDIQRLADLYANSTPTATLIGTGLQRYPYGGENVRFINALAMLTGNIGRSGGGSHYHMHSLRHFNLSWMAPDKPLPRRSLRIGLIGEEILNAHHPALRMIWINGHNIVNQAPDSRRLARAMAAVDFKVVVDAFMTDTARCADLVLPATLMLEQEDVVGSFMHDFVNYVRPVVPHPTDARDDYTILRDLGRRLDPPIHLPEPHECLEKALTSATLSCTLETLRQKGFTRAESPEVPYALGLSDHADGKYRLPIQLHGPPPIPVGYPLRLLTLIRRDAIHSQIAPEQQSHPPVVWLSPDSPALEGIDPNLPVRIRSPLGYLSVRLKMMPGLHPTTIVYRRGDWMELGGGANQLIEAVETDLGNGTAYYHQHVCLENGPQP